MTKNGQKISTSEKKYMNGKTYKMFDIISIEKSKLKPKMFDYTIFTMTKMKKTDHNRY